MIGNDLARFCGQCNLNVYNLSGMTKAEAESFVTSGEGRLCVRFYRRKDGSILTDNCPVGLRKIRRRLSYIKKAIASTVISFLAGLGLSETFSMVAQRLQPRVMGTIEVSHSPVTPLTPDPPDQMVMGGLRPVTVGRVLVQRKGRSSHK
jgi:hypothetical protein